MNLEPEDSPLTSPDELDRRCEGVVFSGVRVAGVAVLWDKDQAGLLLNGDLINRLPLGLVIAFFDLTASFCGMGGVCLVARKV